MTKAKALNYVEFGEWIPGNGPGAWKTTGGYIEGWGRSPRRSPWRGSAREFVAKQVKPKANRPLCGARCRTGKPCRARVVLQRDAGGRIRLMKRCRMHGGILGSPEAREKRRLGGLKGSMKAAQNRAAREAARALGSGSEGIVEAPPGEPE